MPWVEGYTLNSFVKEDVDRPRILKKLARIWVRMARHLREAGIAHADLQHGNVLLLPGTRTAHSLAIKLVDYDGMIVPALANSRSGEVGHPAYQHPQRQRESIYSGEVDRFPHLVIYTALRALMVGGGSLWERYDNGDNLLFRAQDFEAPAKSLLFYELLKIDDADVRRLVEALIDACRGPLGRVPLLDELVGTEQATTAAADDNKAPSGMPEWLKDVFAAATAPNEPLWAVQPPPVRRGEDVFATVLIASEKSVGVAILLTVLFGPLGMFYSTVAGGLIMLVVSIVFAACTFGLSLLITWPICIIWAAVAASNSNASLRMRL